MFHSARVVGRGRIGTAVRARLNERGLRLVDDSADLVLLCVPDSAIRDVACGIGVGPWLAHVSGATSLAALEGHVRRFSVHPLQTFTLAGGSGQFDGAWGAITGENDEALSRAHWVAQCLGLRPFRLADEQRILYHAGAVIASNYLVTLYRVAARLFAATGAPPEALLPLMHRTIENGFQLTGPIARGDLDTVEAHRAELERHFPELTRMYDALHAATIP